MPGLFVSDDPLSQPLPQTGWLFLFAVLMAAGLLFTMVFFVRVASPFRWVHVVAALNADVQLYPLEQIIMFSDLECDYINPIDLCNKLNQVRTHSPLSIPLLTQYLWRCLVFPTTLVCVT